MSIRSGRGSPSILNSGCVPVRRRHSASCAAIARTSAGRICRSSARGCTVIPGAPASRHVVTASVTLGTFPPRELRRVAILLTLTDRLMGMGLGDGRPHGVGYFLGPRLNRRLILALNHDAKQRLGA